MAVTESKRERIADLCSRGTEGTTTMLFSFEGGDAKSSIIRRRTLLLLITFIYRYSLLSDRFTVFLTNVIPSD